MSALRAEIDKTLLEAGISLQVMVITRHEGPPGPSIPYPSLALFGHLDRAAIYLIATRLDIIPRARGAGFRSVDFFAKYGGHWLFNISQPGPSCARDLCF